MKVQKKTDLIAILIFILILGADQITKWLAVNHISNDLPNFFVGLSLHYNFGVFGGFMSSVPKWINQIFFSVIGVFFSVFSIITFYFLKDKNLPLLKTGSILFGSSLLSNVWDRSTRGFVVDFITLRFSSENWFIFNLADAFLVVGVFFISLSLLFEQKKIWRETESRKKTLIDPSFQIHYILILVVTGMVNALMIGVYSFAFLGVYISSTDPQNIARGPLLTDFGLGLLLLETCYLVLIAWLGLLFSHRVAGPILAFESFIEKLLKKQTKESEMEILKLRKNDHFKILEKIATQLLKFNQKP